MDDRPHDDGPWEDPFARQLSKDQGLFVPVLAGAVAGAAGVSLWLLLTWHTGNIFAVMALGIGYLIGFAVKVAARGPRPMLGVVAAIITLLSSLVALVLSVAAIIARAEELPLGEALERLEPSVVTQVLGQLVSPFTIVIVLFAAYESARVAMSAALGKRGSREDNGEQGTELSPSPDGTEEQRP